VVLMAAAFLAVSIIFRPGKPFWSEARA
jgi:hypothetical protein